VEASAPPGPTPSATSLLSDAPSVPAPSTDAAPSTVDVSSPVDAGTEETIAHESGLPVLDAMDDRETDALASFYCYAGSQFVPCDVGTGSPGWWSETPSAPCTTAACPVGAACLVPAHGLVPTMYGVCR
jgi:hypothetical protein